MTPAQPAPPLSDADLDEAERAANYSMLYARPSSLLKRAIAELRRLRAPVEGASSLREAAAPLLIGLWRVLEEVRTNGEWTEGEFRGEWKISKEVYEMVCEAVERQPLPAEGMARDLVDLAGAIDVGWLENVASALSTLEAANAALTKTNTSQATTIVGLEARLKELQLENERHEAAEAALTQTVRALKAEKGEAAEVVLTLQARVAELEGDSQELKNRRAFEEAQEGSLKSLGESYVWASSELTRRKAWSKSAVAAIIAEQHKRAEAAELRATSAEAEIERMATVDPTWSVKMLGKIAKILGDEFDDPEQLALVRMEELGKLDARATRVEALLKDPVGSEELRAVVTELRLPPAREWMTRAANVITRLSAQLIEAKAGNEAAAIEAFKMHCDAMNKAEAATKEVGELRVVVEAAKRWRKTEFDFDGAEGPNVDWQDINRRRKDNDWPPFDPDEMELVNAVDALHAAQAALPNNLTRDGAEG